jgi:hypothetical protein
MRTARFHAGLLGLTLTLLTAASVRAQTIATALEDLNRVGSATTVTVTAPDGQVFRGTIADVSKAALVLHIGREIRRFTAEDISTVRMRKEDPLANGALIGAAVGAGLTSLLFLDNECRDDPACYQAVAVYGGLGALAGLTIDAFIHASVVLYTAPRSTAAFCVEPIGRNGVRLRITF